MTHPREAGYSIGGSRTMMGEGLIMHECNTNIFKLKFSLFVKAKRQHHDFLFPSCLLKHSYTHEPMRTEDGGQQSCLIRELGVKKRLLVLHMYNKRKFCCVLGNLVIFK